VSLATVSSGGAQPDNRGDDGTGLKPGWGVSPERQQALSDAMHALAPVAADCRRPSCGPHHRTGGPPRPVGRPGGARSRRPVVAAPAPVELV